MKKYSAEKEAKYLSILMLVIGIILIVLAFLPSNLTTQILMKIVIAFLIGSGISFWCRHKYWERK